MYKRTRQWNFIKGDGSCKLCWQLKVAVMIIHAEIATAPTLRGVVGRPSAQRRLWLSVSTKRFSIVIISFIYIAHVRFFPFPLGRRRRARYIPSANKCSSGCLCRSSMFAISLRISDRWFVRGLGVNKEFCLVPLRGPAYYDTSRYACFISPIGCAVTVDFRWFLRTRAAFGKSSFLSVALARSSERSGLSYLFSGNIFW